MTPRHSRACEEIRMPKHNTEGLSFEGMEIEFEKGGDSGGVRPAFHIKDNGTAIVTVTS